MFEHPRSSLAGLKSAIVARLIASNARAWLRSKLGNIGSSSGSTHSTLTIPQSLDYIRAVYEDYVTYGRLDDSTIAGSKILEIGPGDNLGVGLCFLLKGAKQVVCLDRFLSHRDEAQQRAIYAAFRASRQSAEQAALDGFMSLDPAVHFDPSRLNYVSGIAIEDLVDPATRYDGFDLIVSRAVLEHVWDLDRAIVAMDRVLNPGGRLIHKVDFRDHGIFTSQNHHPLSLLTIPNVLYDLASRNSGKPNRRLIGDFRRMLGKLGYKTQIWVPHLVGTAKEFVPHLSEHDVDARLTDDAKALLDSIRPSLRPEFRNLTDHDLIIAGVFFVAEKPTR